MMVLLLVSLAMSVTLAEFAHVARTPRLRVDGRWVRNVVGSIVRLRGAAVFWRFVYADRFYNYNPLGFPDEINEASLDTFKSTGANFIRLSLNGWTWYVKKAPKYIAAVDTVIGWCKARGIMVVLDNHPPWYDRDKDVDYKDQIALTTELTEWKGFMVELAQRYKNNPTVIGFDMLNEPRPVSEWQTNGYSPGQAWNIWRTNVLEVARAIHAVDPNYLLFVEPLGSSAQSDDMNNFKTNPLPEPNIVYCTHIYMAWNRYDDPYVQSYSDGNYVLARQQMEQTYVERFLDMLNAGFPVMNMETGVYKDATKNPHWDVWMNDSLSLYEKYGAGVSWFPFDPDSSGSSMFSLLNSDRTTLTSAGMIWAAHMIVPQDSGILKHG
jgi:aryl-phospho-beta-D-glucosidase BglC (GH1 family)